MLYLNYIADKTEINLNSIKIRPELMTKSFLSQSEIINLKS